MPRSRASGCAIWHVGAASTRAEAVERPRAGRALRDGRAAPRRPASPSLSRRAPERPAHAPETAISWHQLSSGTTALNRRSRLASLVNSVLSLGTHDSGGVGERLRTARRSAGLTQKQLAEALGVESITVSRWERGVTTPSLSRLRRIAEITQTTASDLVRAPDAATAHAVELAALREELAETRALVDRVARTLEQLAQPRLDARSRSAFQES